MDGQIRVRWSTHQGTILSVFDTLLATESLVDVTLACEGQYIRVHKVILSACSPYFQDLINVDLAKHPILFLNNVKYAVLKALVHYMYRGEVDIPHDQLPSLLAVAQALQIRGLVDVETANHSISSDTVVLPPHKDTGRSKPPPSSTVPPQIPPGPAQSLPTTLPPKAELNVQPYPAMSVTSTGVNLEAAGAIEVDIESEKDNLASQSNKVGDEVGKATGSMAGFCPSILERSFAAPSTSVLTASQCENTEEIPLLFYTEFLQNSDMQELLAGKITECLDSKDPQCDGDEVVKAVGSMAEKEIVDAFFKDFFEIELGVIGEGASTNSSGVANSDRVKDPETLPDPSILPAPVTTSLPPHSVAEVHSEGGECELNEKTCTFDTPILSEPPQPHHSQTISNGNVSSMRTVITVVQDGFRKTDERIGSKVEHSRRKKSQSSYKKPRMIPQADNAMAVDTWSLLGRRSIAPKIPDEERNVTEREKKVVVIAADCSIPAEAQSLSSADVASQVVLEPAPTVQENHVTVTSSADTPWERHQVIDADSNIDDGESCDVGLEQRRPLSRLLVQGVQKLLEKRMEQIDSPFPLLPFASLEKSEYGPRFPRQKSFSTPRKRSGHVRNLNFKTPPSLRRADLEDEQEEGDLVRGNVQRPTREMRSKKKLEWTTKDNPGFSKLGSIDENEEDLTTPVPTPVKVPSPPRPVWVPPPTPRILSPTTRHQLYGSPLPPSRNSPEEHHLAALKRLLGSPLAAGAIPATPGRSLLTNMNLSVAHTPLRISTINSMDTENQAPLSGAVTLLRERQFETPLKEGGRIEGRKDGEPLTPLPLVTSENGSEGLACGRKEGVRGALTKAANFLLKRKAEAVEDEGALKSPCQGECAFAGKPPKKRRCISHVSASCTESSKLGNNSHQGEEIVPNIETGRVLRLHCQENIAVPPPSTPLGKVRTSAGAQGVVLSPKTRERIPALRTPSLPFPETGFPFDRRVDRKPKTWFRTGGRQKALSVSKRTTVISLRSSSTPAPPEQSQSFHQLLRTPLSRSTPSKSIEIASYNGEGQLVKVSDAPPDFSFDEHLRILLRRTCQVPPPPLQNERK